MPSIPPQRYLSEACEPDLLEHGDNYRGVGYRKGQWEADQRYAVMLGLVRDRDRDVTLLDLGCGLAHLLDYIDAHDRYSHIRYSGLDISERYLEAARARRPDAELLQMDILESDAQLGEYDYIVLNGLFNDRLELSFEEMLAYWRELIGIAYRHCRVGIAFNAMSKIVEWELDSLFHLPLDTMAEVVASDLSRWFVVRHDYRSHQYSVYVYREPSVE